VRETGRPLTLKLNTVRLAADRWQQYRLRLDPAAARVTVTFGPAVDTGQAPLSPDPALSVTEALHASLQLDYFADTPIDIFDGPTYRLAPAPQGRIAVQFIAWHRQWSHSLPASLVCAGLGALGWGMTGALIAGGAHLAHVLLDQTGFMGNNLWFPFERTRRPGLRWTRSADGAANFAAVWLCLLLIFWNLYRGTLDPGFTLDGGRLFFYGALLPGLGVWLWRRRGAKPATEPVP